MLQMSRHFLGLILVLACSACVVVAADADKDAVAVNVKGDGVRRIEANQSQIGFTSTRIFYIAANQSAIVVIQIDNTSEKFPVTGKAYQFAKGVSADDLGKWVNNQHSDGLFPEVPEPQAVHQLPADSIKTTSSKKLGQEKGGFRGETYDKYTVEFQASAVELAKKLKIETFKDTGTVYIPVPAK